MAQFFINRPIFAWVLAIVTMLAGALSLFTLPLVIIFFLAQKQILGGISTTSGLK